MKNKLATYSNTDLNFRSNNSDIPDSEQIMRYDLFERKGVIFQELVMDPKNHLFTFY